jgi:hypothetical protein
LIRPLVAPSRAGRNTDGLNKARLHWAGRCNDWLRWAALNRHVLHRAGLHRLPVRHGAVQQCAGLSFAFGWNLGLLNSPDSQQACADHRKLPPQMA